MIQSAETLHLCCCSSVKPAPVGPIAAQAALKEDDFPSLSSAAVSAPMTPAYSGQTKKTSSFQEEDFPALVSKVRPFKPAVGTNLAWSSHNAAPKTNTHQPPPTRAPPPVSSASSGPQLLSSSNSSTSRRKKKVGENGKAAPHHSPPLSDDESGGMTQQEFRSVPTMLDISSLLTVKGGNSKPSSVTSTFSNPTPNTDQPTSKSNKKKKQKSTTASSASVPTMSGGTAAVDTRSVETTAQKENVPEKTLNKQTSNAAPVPVVNGVANGRADTPPAVCRDAAVVTPSTCTEPAPEPEEFPALITKKPPPGTSISKYYFNCLHR